MKRLFSLLVLMVACSFSFATVHTLCNMPYSPGQFTNFITAQTAASNGDTIYVHGSDLNYGNITVSKSLVIIGTGHHPDKQSPLVSMFQDIIVFASGVQLIGLKFRFFGTNASNGVIKRCRIENTSGNPALQFSSSPVVSNWLIEGNIIQTTNFGISFGGGSANNFIIRNNIFNLNSGAMINLTNSAVQATYFLNNLVLGMSGFDSFFNISYTTINNNIFIGSSPDRPGSSVNNCTMNNNISYLNNDPVFHSPGSNNLENVDPEFVSFTFGNGFNYTDDFHLAPGSPGLITGSDGTDRGVYGGLGFRFNMTGEPSIAEISTFTITSPTTIPPGGNLTISVTSKRVP